MAVYSRRCLTTKQSSWDSPDVTQARQQDEGLKCDASEKAQFLAASAPHSGDLLLALPVASCGLKLDDEAVALRLGLNLGAPHTCRCGATVDAVGQHSLVCKQAPSMIARHEHDLSGDPCLGISGRPCHMEPVALIRRDDKRPDGMTQLLGGQVNCLSVVTCDVKNNINNNSNNNNNNNNNKTSIFIVLSSFLGDCESSLGSSDECGSAPYGATLGPSLSTGP